MKKMSTGEGAVMSGAIHLGQRWPAALRDRLKAWADARGIGLASAILIIVADRLNADEVKL